MDAMAHGEPGVARNPIQAGLRYRFGILGCPQYPHVAWTPENLARMKDLGFNTLQLNIAWGWRPADEPLNLEDLVDVPAGYAELRQPMPLQSDPSPERLHARREDLRRRIALCQEAGIRSVFHFGAPYIGDRNYHDASPNCLLDGKTPDRCAMLLDVFASEFPGIDDIHLYTYDQHSWLCSEFGPCPRCTGIPLDQRVVPFVERLAATWRRHNPDGRLWWEPWELSAGQVLKAVEAIAPKGIGLALHSNIAEVMATLPVDRWLKNTCRLAAQRGIPVLVEHWLGSATEEVEPYLHLAYPLVTLRALREIAAIPDIAGIKEYYGLLPDREDPNLRITALFLSDPLIEEDEALSILSTPYGPAAETVAEFWRLSGDAMELFPWDASWLLRGVGRSDPSHGMSAAIVRGHVAHTPSWESTRRAIFMKTETEESDPWLLEDLQLRFELAADRMAKALTLGRSVEHLVPEAVAASFRSNLEELVEMRRRALAYTYHLRETNTATAMRQHRDSGRAVPADLLNELLSVMDADRVNQGQAEPLSAAIELARNDLAKFLDTYFLPEPDRVSKGYNSFTSR